jgi:alkanesulfonate monooxygenase SsuD/methylene tetrahydromethanopterin reductase-like flavin-dependent oxidoreductase (luciferase family)
MVAVFVICAPTHEEAERLAVSIDLRRLRMAYGQDDPIATVEEALAVQVSEADRALIQRERARTVIGTPETVKARLLELQQQFQADEVMVITITGDYASRLRSYELLAHAFAMEEGHT